MKARTCLAILQGLVLLAVSEIPALATYNPQTGRWLSRDPMEESGHQSLIQGRPSLMHQSEESLLYGFVRNDPVGHIDADGRFTGSQCPACGQWYQGIHRCQPRPPASRTIPHCSIEIYAYHGFLLEAFGPDRQLLNPQLLANLPLPRQLQGSRCSAGTVIACNAAKFASVAPGIPGVSLPDSDITRLDAINLVAGAVSAAQHHALTICRSCCCPAVTISVMCGPGFVRPRWLMPGSHHCDSSYTVRCPGWRPFP